MALLKECTDNDVKYIFIPVEELDEQLTSFLGDVALCDIIRQ